MDRSRFECRTARLHMAALGAGDEALYCSLYTDAATMRWIGPVLTPAEALRGFRTSLRAWERPRPRRAIVVFRESHAEGKSIGIGGYFNARVDPDSDSIQAESGVMLQAGGRGQGLGTETFRALVEHGFHVMPVAALTARCSISNRACEAALRRAGFVPVQTPDRTHADQREWIVMREARAAPCPGVCLDASSGRGHIA